MGPGICCLKDSLPEAIKGQTCCHLSCPGRDCGPGDIWTEVSLAAAESTLGLFPDFLVHQSCLFTGLGGKFHHLVDKSVDRERGQRKRRDNLPLAKSSKGDLRKIIFIKAVYAWCTKHMAFLWRSEDNL